MDMPCSYKYHYTYGMYIRNKYILCNDFSEANFIVDPDALSDEIIKTIFSLLLPGYVNGNCFIERMFDNEQFLVFRRAYNKRYGAYPDEWLTVYDERENRELIEDSIRFRTVYDSRIGKEISAHVFRQNIRTSEEKTEERTRLILSELLELYWKTDEFYKMTDSFAIDRNEITIEVEKIKRLFWNNHIVIPLEICLLKYEDRISSEKCDECKEMLKEAASENGTLLEKLNVELKKWM